MTTATRTETGMLLDAETSDMGLGDRVLRLTARLVYFDGGEIRNFVGGSFDPHALEDLTVTAQADRASDDAYGWRVEYSRPYSVDLRRAEQMAKTLRKVDAGLRRIEKRDGYPESFGQYLARVATVLGVDPQRRGWRKGPDANGIVPPGEWRWTDASGLTAHVRQVVHEFKKGASS